jgi:hypothetical protein
MSAEVFLYSLEMANKGKVIPLHAIVAHGVREGIARTHS